MDDRVKLAGVVDVVGGGFLFVILGLLSISNEVPDLRAATIAGSCIGAVMIAIGILVLMRKPAAALVGTVFYGATAALVLIANLADKVKMKNNGAYVLFAAFTWAVYFHATTWKTLRDRRRLTKQAAAQIR